MNDNNEKLCYELFTIEEAMKILRMGRTTAYQFVKKPENHCFKLANSWRIPRETIEEILNRAQKEEK